MVIVRDGACALVLAIGAYFGLKQATCNWYGHPNIAWCRRCACSHNQRVLEVNHPGCSVIYARVGNFYLHERDT